MSDKSQADAAQDLEPLACVACRARKLKCDRSKGTCKRCHKVATECVYPESRRKPTFKRRNVKELEARLAQVEDYLKEVNQGSEDVPINEPDSQSDDFDVDTGLPSPGTGAQPRANTTQPSMPFDMPNFDPAGDFAFGGGELMGLGMSEALPPFEVLEELNNEFFQVSHHFIPIVHPGRYYQMFYGNAVRKPALCLQYAIWAMGAHLHPKYSQYAEIFYRRARHYADADEMKGFGEHFITVQHAQAWAIIASYEVKMMFFTRAAMSSARCIRLVNMMGLDRMDQEGLEIPPALGPATSWAEIEERRRVFWGVFAIDAHASISTGWPSLVNMDDVMTRLPASEEAFQSGEEEQTTFIDGAFSGAPYSAFAGTIVICHILKTIMFHVHRPRPSDNAHDLLAGIFWTRHRDLDNKLSGAFMFLPPKFRLPDNSRDPAAVHTNLNLHASVICLHHAAIEMCDKHDLPESEKRNSISRLKTSAEEIAHIVKLTAHHNSIFKSPLCALSMYCATTVYIYLAKHERTAADLTSIDMANLDIITQAMEAIGRTHEITRAFLRQVWLDVERNDLKVRINVSNLSKYSETFSGGCAHTPLLARGQVAKHTQLSCVLPGKLPLDGPVGVAQPAWRRQEDCHECPVQVPPPEVTEVVRNLINSECFQPILRASNRNIAPPTNSSSHKRKRMSPSPAPEFVDDLDMLMAGGQRARQLPDMQKQYERMAPGLAAVGLWRAGGLSLRPGQQSSGASLGSGSVSAAALTNSSASSSPNVCLGTVANTSARSGSSHTSPGWGLGNTAEENRVDLRPFQDRITTPIWQATDESLFNHMSETMINAGLPPDGSDPWGLLTAEVDWDAIPGVTGQVGKS